jgi:hypothetical protein
MPIARIEALLRDALGQEHGVWEWRVKQRARTKGAEEIARQVVDPLHAKRPFRASAELP